MSRTKNKTPMTNDKIITQRQYQKLQKDISKLLEQTKEKVQKVTNVILANFYWQIGKRISEESLTNNSNYQSLLLQELEKDLSIDKRTLGQSVRFYENYPDGAAQDLSWSHYRRLITINDKDSRSDLAKKAEAQKWSVRQLETSIKELNSGAVATAGAAGSKKSTAKVKIKRPADPSYLYKARIIDVVDGDTLILHIDLGFEVIKKQRVRLAKINAPEMKTKAGEESYRYLRDLCANIKEIAIKTNKVDIYGRFLGDIFYLPSDAKRGTTQGDIFTKGIYLNQKLIDAGVAEMFS